MSFLDSLVEHAKNNLGKSDFDRSEAYAFSRKCRVHFLRSARRIVKNHAVVSPTREDEFRELLSSMQNSKSTAPCFERVCIKLVKQFPKCKSWLK